MLLLTLRNGAEAPGYSPIFIAAMLAMAGLAARRALRVRREPPREPVWNGGFAALPPWLPFGDPAAQFGPASFVAPLRKLATLLPRIDMQSSLHQMRAAVQRATTAWMAR
jgi:hypothetical protein